MAKLDDNTEQSDLEQVSSKKTGTQVLAQALDYMLKQEMHTLAANWNNPAASLVVTWVHCSVILPCLGAVITISRLVTIWFSESGYSWSKVYLLYLKWMCSVFMKHNNYKLMQCSSSLKTESLYWCYFVLVFNATDITFSISLWTNHQKDNWVAECKRQWWSWEKWNLNFLIHYFTTRIIIFIYYYYYLPLLHYFRNDQVFES